MSEVLDGYVTIRRPDPAGMVTLRGDLAAARVQAAVAAATGCAMPDARRIVTQGDRHLAWMSPDEAMVFCPCDQAATLAVTLTQALAGQVHMALDVSDARVMFELGGDRIREVLSKLTPADVARLPLGEVRRSRLGQVAGAFWLTAPDRARIIVFRSVADYAALLLAHAARKGSEIDA